MAAVVAEAELMRRGRVANSDADFDRRLIRVARRQGHRHNAAGNGAARDAGCLGKLKTARRFGPDLDLEDDRPAGLFGASLSDAILAQWQIRQASAA